MTPDETSAVGAQDEQAEKPVFDPDQLALIPEIDSFQTVSEAKK